jgi:DNA-directed RNA polymerase specialized sigma24 family protein
MSAAIPTQASQPQPEDILARMRTGDREAVGEFVTRYGDLIRLRIRDKLGPRLRRILDSEDVLSTVTRRLDGLVRDRAIRAGSNAELWSLVAAIANHAVAESARSAKREQNTLESAPRDSESEEAAQPTYAHATEDSALTGIVGTLQDETDRRILWGRLHDHAHEQIAEEIGSTPSAVRMRWSRIRKLLRDVLRQ